MNDQDVLEIKADVKEVKKDMKDVVVTLARNTSSLEAHMARTEVCEKRMDRVENWLLGLLTSLLVGLLYYVLKR